MTQAKYGYVYFIKPTAYSGPIKIGCSKWPDNRLSDILAWSPIPLEILGSVPGDFSDERYLHRCFADAHSHKEWFHPTPKLKATIQTILLAGTVDVVRGDLKPVGTKYPCFPSKPKRIAA
ncbi:MAG TPA: GIY-YIG nuclease family protein [Alphaproteobacteria bacterium]|nr:GIY-YIG nuclease family protein [Alphaproteobacteria bacterium]